MNGFEIRKELRHYREQRRAERMDAIIATFCIVGLAVLLVMGALE
jgi:cytochrome c-type biogenesis protein CcmE